MKYKVFKVLNPFAKEDVLEKTLDKIVEDGYKILWITSNAAVHFIVCEGKK